jgi:hypothetical protein
MKVLKEQIQAKRAEKKLQKQQIALSKPPRYDDVFFKGVKWLDSLAGDLVQEQEGEMDPVLSK